LYAPVAVSEFSSFVPHPLGAVWLKASLVRVSCVASVDYSHVPEGERAKRGTFDAEADSNGEPAVVKDLLLSSSSVLLGPASFRDESIDRSSVRERVRALKDNEDTRMSGLVRGTRRLD
jgi:hypothetical protein